MTAAPVACWERPLCSSGVPGRTDAAACPWSFHTLADTALSRSRASSLTACKGRRISFQIFHVEPFVRSQSIVLHRLCMLQNGSKGSGQIGARLAHLIRVPNLAQNETEKLVLWHVNIVNICFC